MYIFCVSPFLIISKIYPVLAKTTVDTPAAIYPACLDCFLFCVCVAGMAMIPSHKWVEPSQAARWHVEALAIGQASQILLLDHHVRWGPSSWARLDHAAGPGVEHLLALPHHALARAELGVAGRVLGTARPSAFAWAPVHHSSSSSSSSKLLATRALRGALRWVACCLVALRPSSWTVSPVVANIAVVTRRLLLQFKLRWMVFGVAVRAQLLGMVVVEL